MDAIREDEGGKGQGRRWAAFARSLGASAAGLLAAYLGLAVLVDPYDSGRSGLLSVGAVRPQGPRTAAALRGRDPAFAGAILGNSHIQLVAPEALSARTGIPFVQLSVPATGPGEQLVLLDWFLRHHPEPRALVVSADEYWCTDDADLPNVRPFPFWLYAEGSAAYLRGLLRWSVAQEVAGRLGWRLRGAEPRARADGFWDYEADYLALGYADDPGRALERTAAPPDTPEPGRAGPGFPAADRLAARARTLPAATALVLVFPPVHTPGQPRAGTPRAGADAACKAALAQAAQAHPRARVLDWRRDRPELADPTQFFDQRHYRHPLARRLSAEIAEALAALAPHPAGE